MSKQISKLTAKQEAMLPQVREEWLERCLACRPGDRRAAEAALAGAYQAAGLAPPRLYLWARNPMEGVEMLGGMAVAGDPIARSVARVLGGQVVGQVDGRVRSEVASQVADQVDRQVDRQVAGQVRSQVAGQVERQVGSQIHGQVERQVADQIADQIAGQVERQVDRQVADQVDHQVEHQVADQVERQVDRQVADQVDRLVARQVANQVCHQVVNQVDRQVERQVGSQIHGQVLRQVADQIAGQIERQVAGQVRSQVAGQVERQVGSQIHGQVGSQIHGQVERQVADQIAGQVAGQVVRKRFAAIKDFWWQRLWGQYDGWLSYYGAMDRLGVDCTAIRPLMELAGHAGWCWVMPDVAILVERHTVLHRDPEGRLHCEDGPAIGWPGWSFYAWHGTIIPSEWIESDALTPEIALTWPNVERRLAALEIVTWERIVAHLDPEIIDEDPDPKFGTLLRCDLPGAPASQFLRARCGTGRVVVIPVASDCTTAIEAGARSYGLTPEQYREIEVRT